MAPKRSEWITFAILLGLSIILALATFYGLWQPLFLAAVLSSALGVQHERLARKLKQRRYVSAALFTVGIAVLILLPVTIVVAIALSETVAAVDFIRTTLASGGVQAILRRLPDVLEGRVRWVLELFGDRSRDLIGQAAGTSGTALKLVGGAISVTGSALFDGVMMLIALHYLLADGPALIRWLEDVAPLRGRQTAELLREFSVTSKSALGSLTVTAGVQGLAATVGYVIAGVPQPFFFGVLTFVAAFIPSIGTAIISLPLAAGLILLGNTGWGIFLGIWSLVVVALVDNLLKPILMKDQLNLHGAVVFFALVGGILFFGPVGLIAGPLSVTFFLTMIRLGTRDFSPG